jgi:hypothetical protein
MIPGFRMPDIFFKLQLVQNKEYHSNEQQSKVEEEALLYGHSEAKERERLRQAIRSSATEKFHVLMTLMKANEMMKRAKIHHKPVK